MIDSFNTVIKPCCDIGRLILSLIGVFMIGVEKTSGSGVRFPDDMLN